jgi:hypothetical protein
MSHALIRTARRGLTLALVLAATALFAGGALAQPHPKPDKGHKGHVHGKAHAHDHGKAHAHGKDKPHPHGKMKAGPHGKMKAGPHGKMKADPHGQPRPGVLPPGHPPIGGKGRMHGRTAVPGKAHAMPPHAKRRPDPRVAKEEHKHLKRLAKIARIETLGKQNGKPDLVEKAKTLRQKEARRHQRVMLKLRKPMKAHKKPASAARREGRPVKVPTTPPPPPRPPVKPVKPVKPAPTKAR